MALGGALKSVFTRFTFGIDQGKLAAVNQTTGRAVTNLSMAAKKAAALKSQVGGFIGNIKGMIAVVAGGAVLRSLTSGYAQAADQVAKFSKATGVATDTYQGFIHAAGLSGITNEEVNKSLLQLSKRAYDASIGMKATKDAFNDAGIDIRDANGKLKNGDRILLELADRFKKMPDGTRKTGLAMALMGRTGAKLNVLLNEGSEGIKGYVAEAKKLGIVLSGKALSDAEKFNDEWLRAKSVFIGLRNQIASRLVPAVTKAITAFVKWTREGENAKRMLQALAVVAGIASVIIANMIRGFIIAQWKVFLGIIKGLVKWFRALNVQMLLASLKIAAIAAGVILLAAIIEDLVYFAQGERSLTGRLFGQDKDILAGLQLIKAEFVAVIGILSTEFGALWESIVMLGAAFGIKLTTIGALAKKVGKILFKGILFVVIGIGFAIGRIVRWMAILVGWIAVAATWFVDVLGGAVRGVIAIFEDFWGSLQAGFDAIELAGLKVANTLKAAFEAAARFATEAWAGFKTFLGTIKDKVVSLGGRAKNFLLRRNTGAVGNLENLNQGPPVPRQQAAPVVVNATTTVNTAGMTPEQSKRVAKAAAEGVVNSAVAGALRNLAPAGVTGVPALVP